jgi:hypothetical protein
MSGDGRSLLTGRYQGDKIGTAPGTDKGQRGLGVTENGTDLGFFCHPTLVVAPKDQSIRGVLDIHTWEREAGMGEKTARHNRSDSLPIEEKETYRWISCAIEAKKRLPEGQRALVVQDREGDIYESLNRLQEEGLDYVIRVSHDQILFGREEHLKEYMNGLDSRFEYNLEVKGDKKGRKERMAQMEIRYGKERIRRSKNLVNREAYPCRMEIEVVYVKEKARSMHEGKQPIE